MTGVQTCALPILPGTARVRTGDRAPARGRSPRGRPFDQSRRIDDEDRKSVVQGKSVDLGGRRIIKKKNTNNRIQLH